VVSAPTTLKRLNDAQLAIAESHPDWRKYGGKCPTCEDTGSFVYGGNTYPCPDDDYGHTRTRLFAQYLAANIPEQYQVLQWSEYPHWEVREAVDAYLENFESFYHHGMGMEFLSRAQAVGKTWAATHILREVVKRSYKGWFVDFAQMKGYAELEDREERIWKTRMVRETPVLVIDDVRKPWSGSAPTTTWSPSSLQTLKRPRWRSTFLGSSPSSKPRPTTA
jgi:hypothetical protein